MENIILVIFSYFLMEFVAWSNHKYVMHGFLWKWHRDHHHKDHQYELPENTEGKKLEKNDLFFLVYALPAIALMITGFSIPYYPLVFISIGISLYGLTYFIIHDVIIHKRLKVPFLQNSRHIIIRGIVKAHQAHHWPKTKNDFKNFGLLVFPLHYFNK